MHDTVKELVDQLITAYTTPGQPYNHEDYGYVILIEEGDIDRTLLTIPWEGIMLRGDFYIAIYLANNEHGLVFVIPDAEWVNDELRDLIEDILDPVPLN